MLRPLIIVGAARSGTNLLRDVLCSLPAFGTWPCDEINPIWRHGNRSFPTDALGPEQASDPVRAFIRSTFTGATRRYVPGNHGVLVEKTCANSLRVRFIREVLPEARFVHLVRDGRDVTASAIDRWTGRASLRYTLSKARFVPPSDLPSYGWRFVSTRLGQLVSRDRQLATWGPRFNGIDALVRTESLARVCAAQWRACVETSTADLQGGPDWRAITVRYEDLATDPVSEVVRITDWLRVCRSGPWTLEDAPRSDLEALAGTVRGDSIGRWRERMPGEGMEEVRGILEPTMNEHGYEWS